MFDDTFYTKKATDIRKKLFEKFVELEEGHPGSIFSMIEIVVSLYYGGFIRFENENLTKDKVIVSKGHATSVLYPILNDLGIISDSDWNSWGKTMSNLKVFGNVSIPGIDTTSGSLGHGLGIGAGYALSFEKRKLDKKVYVIISEGELYEGSTWESLLFINHHHLNNLKIIIDRNNLIILGDTESNIKLEPIDDKFKAFGFNVNKCDGHNFKELIEYFDKTKNTDNLECLIANTIKGKGLSLFENKAKWHHWHKIDEKTVYKSRKEFDDYTKG